MRLVYNRYVKALLLTLLVLLSINTFAQMPTWWGLNGSQVVTCRADDDGEYSMGIMDTRDRTTAPLSLDWMPTMYHHPSWTRANLGQVLGIALDGNNNIYVTASSSYGMPNAYNSPDLTGIYGLAGSGGIYRIDAVTGAINTFAIIPQDSTVLVHDDTGPNVLLEDKDGTNVGVGLGNICYDADHNQFFVTSFDDGKIHRIDASGGYINSFDPQTAPGFIADPSPTDTGNSDVISPLGDRPWGVGYYSDKVYFSVWTEDRERNSSTTANTIYSIGLDGTGDFTGTEQLEITMPGFQKDGQGSSNDDSNPISDIEFDFDGNMAIAERGMESDVDASGHRSNVFYFERQPDGSYISPTQYKDSPPQIRIGTAPNNDNGSASGGVDFTFDGYNGTEASGTLSYIWATGHRLRNSGDDGGPGGGGYVLSGSQMSPVTGFAVNGNFWETSYFVDFDGVSSGTNKTAQGDVDIVRALAPPCTTPAAPIVSITDNDCGAGTTGTINIDTPCAAGSHIEYSTDGGVNWTTTQPPYTSTAFTFLSRCVDDSDATCFSTNDSDATNPNICGSCAISNPGVVSTDCTTPGTIFFTLNPQGGSSATYNVSASSGTVSPSSSNFGQGTKFALTGYSGTTVTITIADSSDPTCNETFDIDTNTCNYACAACAPVCTIIIDSVSSTNCDSNTNTYDLDVTIEYVDPASGDIQIDVAGVSQTFTPDGSGTETFTVTGLPADGSTNIDVSTSFVNDGACRFTGVDLYDTPDCSTTPIDPCNNPQCTQNNEYFLCSNGTDSIDLNVEAGATNIMWYDGDGNLLGSSTTMTFTNTDIGNGTAGESQCFYYTAQDSNSCDGYTCCPVILTVEDCCPDNNCFGIQIINN